MKRRRRFSARSAQFTHQGYIYDHSEAHGKRTLLRETRLWWVTAYGWSFSKKTGAIIGEAQNWSIAHLDLSSIIEKG